MQHLSMPDVTGFAGILPIAGLGRRSL